MKVNFFDRWVIEKFGKIAAIISTIFSIGIIYIPQTHQSLALCLLLLCLGISYLVVWFYANQKKTITLKIRNTKIIIKEGDLLAEECKKVIPVNEFFDTSVGNGVVDPQSLHGKYITNYVSLSPVELYNDIVRSLQNAKFENVNPARAIGGQIQYELGTIYDDKHGFLLLAYSRFDNNNRAYLKNHDIMKCYMNMWMQIDIHRGNSSISFPVLGASGMVRFSKDYSPQQLIELMLWSFRISGINLSRQASLNIIVHKSLVDEIHFLKLANYSD